MAGFSVFLFAVAALSAAVAIGIVRILYSGHHFSYNMDIAKTTKFPVSRKEVMQVSVRERILTIRLIDKVRANPATAEKVGIVVVSELQNVGDIRQKISCVR